MQDYSLIIHNARLIDGSGDRAWLGALAVNDARIVRIDTEISEKSYFQLDARGLCLAPAFILAAPTPAPHPAAFYFAQGIATLVAPAHEAVSHLNFIPYVDVLYSDLPLHEAFKAAKALRLPLILTKLEEAEEEDFKQATQQQIGYFLSQKMHPRALIRAGDACDAFLHFLTHAPLEAAVHRLTGFPAQALGLIGRGVLQEGAFADLVLFDPTQPYENCIQALWVNGVLSFSRGQLTNAVAGHLITRNEMKRLRSS